MGYQFFNFGKYQRRLRIERVERMDSKNNSTPRLYHGEFSDIAFPGTLEELIALGPDFLTQAFRNQGTISRDNRVTTIKSATEFFGGGMGRKLLISVNYENDDPSLHKDLFAKFQLDIGNPLREVFGPLMYPEVRFALLSRHDDFPIPVPKCYFADYNRGSSSGVLITERIKYGNGVIEPCKEKCRDYEMSHPLKYYEALTRNSARLAGFHKSGQLGSSVEHGFPSIRTPAEMGARIPYSRSELEEKLKKISIFVTDNPHLFPDQFCTASFLKSFCKRFPLIIEYEKEIRQYLWENKDFTALCHFNLNLDNAWFWENQNGILQAGILDWGGAGQLCVTQAFYGMVCSAEVDFLNAHKRQLIKLFISVYEKSGGPKLDIKEFLFRYKLNVALVGTALVLDAPSLIEGNVPELDNVCNRFDSRLANNFLGRVELNILLVLFNEWLTEDIGAALQKMDPIEG